MRSSRIASWRRAGWRAAHVGLLLTAASCHDHSSPSPSVGAGRPRLPASVRVGAERADEKIPGAGWARPDAGSPKQDAGRRGRDGGPVPSLERDAAGSMDAAGDSAASTAPGLRVAFLGDQAIGPDGNAVLELIKREQADLVIHPGDFAYVPDVAAWDAQIDAVLGATFPYFAAIGNNDVDTWDGEGGYQSALQARLERVPEATCSGDLGVNSVCRFRGLMFALSGVGTYGTDTEDYLARVLDDPAIWRLCIWHKNQHDMQVGGKSDEVGWRAYQICQANGAPIITAHEHSYGRTYTVTALGDPVAQHGYTGWPEQLDLAPGSTAVFQTGLGGHSYRAWNGDLAPWWATIYAGNKQQQNGAAVGTEAMIEFGALFIDFHVDGDPYKARGYFKTTSGKVVDDFTMRVAR